MMNVRVATPEDAKNILTIYSQYIDTNITFEYELPSVEEFSRRIADTLTTHPYFVCEDDGKIIGYVYAHRVQPRIAYQWGAELSIYLDSAQTARGLGRRLYALLIDVLKEQGVRTVYGCVTSPNPPSERLHEGMGFDKIGIFHKAGFKLGAWHDIVWFEKNVAAYDEPQPWIPFPELSRETLKVLIAQYF